MANKQLHSTMCHILWNNIIHIPYCKDSKNVSWGAPRSCTRERATWRRQMAATPIRRAPMPQIHITLSKYPQQPTMLCLLFTFVIMSQLPQSYMCKSHYLMKLFIGWLAKMILIVAQAWPLMHVHCKNNHVRKLSEPFMIHVMLDCKVAKITMKNKISINKSSSQKEKLLHLITINWRLEQKECHIWEEESTHERCKWCKWQQPSRKYWCKVTSKCIIIMYYNRTLDMITYFNILYIIRMMKCTQMKV